MLIAATDESCLLTRKFLTLNNLSIARTTEYTQGVFDKLKKRNPSSDFRNGFSCKGVTEIHFREKGVKTTAKVYYQDTIFELIVKSLNVSLFNSNVWTFQQASAPAHKTKMTLCWLKENVPDLVKNEDWPSSRPDLNPPDYKLLVLETEVC